MKLYGICLSKGNDVKHCNLNNNYKKDSVIGCNYLSISMKMVRVGHRRNINVKTFQKIFPTEPVCRCWELCFVEMQQICLFFVFVFVFCCFFCRALHKNASFSLKSLSPPIPVKESYLFIYISPKKAVNCAICGCRTSLQ